MKLVYHEYAAWADIDIANKINDRKLPKYFNLETAALVACFSEAMRDYEIAREAPVYFSFCKMVVPDTIEEVEKTFSAKREKLANISLFYGFQLESKDINEMIPYFAEKLSEEGRFSVDKFRKNMINVLRPVDQFKALPNMPVSFISIVFNMHGDNVTLYESASGLLKYALVSPSEKVVISAAQSNWMGEVRAGVLYTTREEIARSNYLENDICAIDMFQNWSQKGFH